jgi:hypothetical protein
MHEWSEHDLITMMEEKRVLIGRKTSWRSDIVCLSSIGISDSKTPKMHTLSEELFKYCPVGLTGSSISSSNPSILSLSFAIAIDSCFNL